MNPNLSKGGVQQKKGPISKEELVQSLLNSTNT